MTLIDRLSKLEGPDREVDAEIEAVFVGGRVHYNYPANKEAVIERPIDGLWIRGIYPYRKIARYTTSVDAALALARRLWPDMMYRVGNDGEGPDPSLYLGEIFIPGEQKDSYFTGLSPVEAVSLCIAILRAKEASHGE